MIENIKVRMNETIDHNYRCWLDAQTTYYYGRSIILDAPDTINEQEQKIDTWLTSINAACTKTILSNCLPEWKIAFKTPKDATLFKMKYVDNS